MKQAHKILLIEDEPMLRIAFSTILSAHNYEVETAMNGIDGLEKLEAFKPDAILLDLLMPQLGGIGFLERSHIKTDYPKTKVVVYSNLYDADTLDTVTALGAHKMILKSSLAPHELVDLIDNLWE